MRTFSFPGCFVVPDSLLLISLFSGPDSRKLVRSLPNVVEYARRIHEEYFADYASPVWE